MVYTCTLVAFHSYSFITIFPLGVKFMGEGVGFRTPLPLETYSFCDYDTPYTSSCQNEMLFAIFMAYLQYEI